MPDWTAVKLQQIFFLELHHDIKTQTALDDYIFRANIEIFLLCYISKPFKECYIIQFEVGITYKTLRRQLLHP